MKKKVSELSNCYLDYAVAKALGYSKEGWIPIISYGASLPRQPGELILIKKTSNVPSGPQRISKDWLLCGEILEKERISINMTRGFITRQPRYWSAVSDNEQHGADDDDPKVAICRCFVRSKLGEEVEIE